MENLKRLTNSREGQALIEYLKKEIDRLSNEGFDSEVSNEVVAREVFAREREKNAYRKLLRAIEIKEEKTAPLKNLEYK